MNPFKRVQPNAPYCTTDRNTAPGPSYRCPKCGKNFSAKSALTRHRRKYHNEEVPTTYHCHRCEFTTLQLWQLRQHTKRDHASEVSRQQKTTTDQVLSTINLEALDLTFKETPRAPNSDLSDALNIKPTTPEPAMPQKPTTEQHLSTTTPQQEENKAHAETDTPTKQSNNRDHLEADLIITDDSSSASSSSTEDSDTDDENTNKQTRDNENELATQMLDNVTAQLEILLITLKKNKKESNTVEISTQTDGPWDKIIHQTEPKIFMTYGPKNDPKAMEMINL